MALVLVGYYSFEMLNCFVTTRLIDSQLTVNNLEHQAGLGPATSSPSRPCMGSSGGSLPDCSTAALSSSV